MLNNIIPLCPQIKIYLQCNQIKRGLLFKGEFITPNGTKLQAHPKSQFLIQNYDFSILSILFNNERCHLQLHTFIICLTPPTLQKASHYMVKMTNIIQSSKNELKKLLYLCGVPIKLSISFNTDLNYFQRLIVCYISCIINTQKKMGEIQEKQKFKSYKEQIGSTKYSSCYSLCTTNFSMNSQQSQFKSDGNQKSMPQQKMHERQNYNTMTRKRKYSQQVKLKAYSNSLYSINQEIQAQQFQSNVSTQKQQPKDCPLKIVNEVKIDQKHKLQIKGGFSNISLAKAQIQGEKQKVIIKCPKVQKYDISKQKLQREIKILSKINSRRHILQYYYVQQKDQLFIQKADDSLTKYRHYNESISGILRNIYQCYDILKELSQNHIVHRDIKPDNLLVTFSKTHMKISVIDFGESTKNYYIEDGEYAYTFPYTPIEACKLNKEQQGLIKLTIDIWSFGMIIHQLYYNENLFSTASYLVPDMISSWDRQLLKPHNMRKKHGLYLLDGCIDILVTKTCQAQASKRWDLQQIGAAIDVLNMISSTLIKFLPIQIVGSKKKKINKAEIFQPKKLKFEFSKKRGK